MLFSHHDRTRIIDDGRQIPLPLGSGARAGTFLLDGFFRGTWKLEDDALHIDPHTYLGDTDATQLEQDGKRLLAFLGAAHDVVTVSAFVSSRPY